MKKNLFLLMTAAALWTACGDNANDTASNSDSTGTINSSADSTSNTPLGTDTTNTSSTVSSQPLDNKSQDFAKEASNAGKMEIELGQLAQQNAADQRVKDFGAMMVRDHTTADQELKGILSRKNFTPPTDDAHAKHKEDLSKKTGAEFDKAYMKMMVEDHKKVIKKFEDAEKNATDPDVKAFASKTLPTLRAHLDSATAISKAAKK